MKIDFSKKVNNPEIQIIFERGKSQGEQYEGLYHICSNPACDCAIIGIDITQSKRNNDHEHCYCFDIDVDRKKVFEKKKKQGSLRNADFIRSFGEELIEDDWMLFNGLYRGVKYFWTEHAPLEKIEVDFPLEEIESSSEMIPYCEILPFDRQLLINIDGLEYIVEDQYCVAIGCGCHKAGLTFIPVQDIENESSDVDVSGCLYVFWDYKNKIWTLDGENQVCTVAPKVLLNEFLRKNFNAVIKKRHQKVRAFYELFRVKNVSRFQAYQKRTGQFSSSGVKVGRNESCPCGSGKKYKKCCGM